MIRSNSVAARRFLCVAVFVSATACRSGDSDTTTASANLKLSPDTVNVTVGGTAQLTLTDASGHPVSGATWTSSDETRVSVMSGVVTAIAPGTVSVVAHANGSFASSVVRSAINKDFSITGAQFTQAVQSAAGDIPMVVGGDAAVVNVLLSTTIVGSESMQLVLRLFDASGALLRSDTLRTSGALAISPTYAAPAVQFMVPASVLTSAASWQVMRDPNGALPDVNPSNDVYPASGHASLSKVTVPSVALRFVPIVLTAHGNATGNVTSALLPEYLHTVKSVHPLGAILPTIGTPFSTAANFGTPPSGGGGSTFWLQLLAELDLARVSDVTGDPNSYWMGIVVPPPGYNYTAYSGYGYIPASGTTRGSGTRTAIGLQAGWASSAVLARNTVAHELGHNFGRAHAPCGGAASPDPLYPFPTGVTGIVGHDVFSWANGEATSAAAQPAQTGDLMGYCTPIWISEYNYRAVLAFRGTTAASLSRVPDPVRSLIVRGSIEDDARVTLEPAFTIVARPTAPERTGKYVLTGRAATGRVLFQYSFDPAVVDHATNVRHFLFAIPATAAIDDSLVTIDVAGGASSAQLRANPAASLRAGVVPSVSAARSGDGIVATCADPATAGIAVFDGSTGSMLGTAAGATMRVVAPLATSLNVVCSDGVRTAAANAVVH